MSALTEQRPYRRQHWLVNRSFQFRFVRAMLLVLLVMAVVAILGMYGALQLTIAAYDLRREAFIVALFNTVAWTVVVEFILLVPIVGWIGLLLTHKVAGPLVRIRAVLAEMTKGNFDIHLRLRKGDALTDLAEDINRLAAFLRSRSSS
jgi:hypothetical protein